MGLLTKGLSTLGFSIPILNELCFFLDSIIYKAAGAALQTFFKLVRITADITAYSEDVANILKRVMVLAGVYALFRGAVMLINYIIDPSKLKEVNKSSGAIIKNIAVAVVLLIASPFIFQQLGRFQGMIITQSVIPKIIYGPDEYDNPKNNIEKEKQSTIFVNRVFLLFLTEKYEGACGDDGADRGKTECINRRNVANGDADILSLVTSTYYFDYTPFISGIVGMVLIYYFTIFAIEIGTRILKLIILQVISPIPVIMSIDPSQKNRLSNFFKAYSGIYIQVFIRILTLYLAFVVLSLIGNSEGIINTGMINGNLLMTQDLGVYGTILLYIGVFQATKELPKLMEDALGLKLGNIPGQGFGSVLKGIIGGSAGLVGGTVAGGISGGLGGALVGGVSGMVNAGMGAAGSKNMAAGVSAAVAGIGKAGQLGEKVANANGIRGFAMGAFDNLTGRNARLDKNYNKANSKVEALDNFEKAVYDDFGKSGYVDPTTGLTAAPMEQDFGVASARNALTNYMNSGTPINMTQYQSLQHDIRTAEDAYKKRAFDWFESTSLDSSRGVVRYDPNKYSSLSESQKAHYELTRMDKNRKPLMVPSGTSGDLYSTFKTERKSAKTKANELKGERQSDRSRNADAANWK